MLGFKLLSILLLILSCTLSYAKSAALSDKKIESIITNAAVKADINPHLLLAVCWIESHYKMHLPEVPDGDTPSYGICQVKLETARYMDALYKHKIKASPERLRDPYVNAFYAAKYIKYQLKRYNNDWKKAVAAYNQGSFWSSSPNTGYVMRVELALQERGLNEPPADVSDQ